MKRKTVDVSSLPLLLRELVIDRLEQTPDLDVFNISGTEADSLQPDVYIIANDDAETETISVRYLVQRPMCTVVAMSETANQFHTYELRYHRNTYTDASLESLMAGIRRSLAMQMTRDDAQALPGQS